MVLSQTDWIMVGPGYLYGEPFVSQCLLYRLIEEDSSIFLRVTRRAATFTQVNRQSNTILTQTEVRSAYCIHLHFSSSAEISIEELVKIPSVEINLAEKVHYKHHLEKLTVLFEQWKVPCHHGFVVTNPNDQKVEHRVDGVAYIIRTPGPLVSACKLTESKLDEATYSCCKVTLLNAIGRNCCDYSSDKSWSLSALRFIDTLPPIYEVTIQRELK